MFCYVIGWVCRGLRGGACVRAYGGGFFTIYRGFVVVVFPTSVPRKFYGRLVRGLIYGFGFRSSIVRSNGKGRVLRGSSRPFEVVVSVTVGLVFYDFIRAITVTGRRVYVAKGKTGQHAGVVQGHPGGVYPRLFVFNRGYVFFFFWYVFHVFRYGHAFVCCERRSTMFGDIRYFFLR